MAFLFSRVLRDSLSHFSVRRSVGLSVGRSQSCFLRFSASPTRPRLMLPCIRPCLLKIALTRLQENPYPAIPSVCNDSIARRDATLFGWLTSSFLYITFVCSYLKEKSKTHSKLHSWSTISKNVNKNADFFLITTKWLI